MRPRAYFTLLVTSALALVAWSCGTLLDASDSPRDDGGTPPDGSAAGDATTDGGASDGGDAAIPGIGTLAPPCPRPNGPTCQPGKCEKRRLYAPAKEGTEFPFGIATDSAFVYWATVSKDSSGGNPYEGRGTARIMRVDRRGVANGGKATIVAENQRVAVAIAMAGDFVYWGALDGTTAKLHRVRRDCASSCQVETLLTFPPGGDPIGHLVAIDDATLIAVAENGPVYVVKASAAGAAVVGNAGTSFFPAVTATSTHGFVSGAITHEVKRIPAQTLTAESHGTVPDAGPALSTGLAPIATDCKNLYGWRGSNNLWKIAGDDGGTATLFSSSFSLDRLFGLAADQKFVYLAAPDGPGVIGMSTESPDGAAPETIAPGNVHRIAVDDVGVYWGDHDQNSGGAMWMMVK